MNFDVVANLFFKCVASRLRRGLLNRGNNRFRVAMPLCFALTSSSAALADDNLLLMSLEDLLEVTVTSVSKKSQLRVDAAAAIRVISKQDIRRSGLTSIPELLRQVPGLHVARIDASKWAISSRGFNGLRANKMLVLMDGRTLYTPLFSGVYWDVQDTLIEDIERIEVILGPGSTLWGSNAVNGVINIITSDSADTRGGLFGALAGNKERSASLRYGGEFGGQATLRGYAKFSDIKNSEMPDGSAEYNAWDTRRAGFRADWAIASDDVLTLQGDIYEADIEEESTQITSLGSGPVTLRQPSDVRGANLLLRWSRTVSDRTSWQFQSYYDQNQRDEISIAQRIDTFDLDLQYRFMTGIHEITWGLGYRHISDEIENSFSVRFDPVGWDQELFSAFVQDEVSLAENLTLTLGSKFEHNEHTGSEIQPSARLLWRMAEHHSLWGAVARSVRTPSRTNRDVRINLAAIPSPGLPTMIAVMGSDDFESEEVISLELGYRGQPSEQLTLDVNAFYNIYDKLYTSEASVPFVEGTPPTNLVMPIGFDNLMEGESYGLDLSLNWQASLDWRLNVGYSWLNVDVRLDAASADTTNVTAREDTSPEHQMQLRSYWDIRHDLTLDATLLYSDATLVEGIDIKEFTRLDLRLGWQLSKELELSLVGQNLLDDRHGEFADGESSPYTEVPRTIYGRLQFRF